MDTETFSGLIMQLAGLGGMEWVIIIGLIVVAFLGVRKIPELARSIGKASGEYEKAKLEAKKELWEMKSEIGVDREKLREIAHSLGIDYTGKSDAELREAIDLQLNKTKH